MVDISASDSSGKLATLNEVALSVAIRMSKLSGCAAARAARAARAAKSYRGPRECRAAEADRPAR